MARDVGQTPTACAMDVQWQCQMATKGSLCVRNNGGNRICPDHQTLHTPMDYRTNPINFFNGGYAQITRHLQRNN